MKCLFTRRTQVLRNDLIAQLNLALGHFTGNNRLIGTWIFEWVLFCDADEQNVLRFLKVTLAYRKLEPTNARLSETRGLPCAPIPQPELSVSVHSR